MSLMFFLKLPKPIPLSLITIEMWSFLSKISIVEFFEGNQCSLEFSIKIHNDNARHDRIYNWHEIKKRKIFRGLF